LCWGTQAVEAGFGCSAISPLDLRQFESAVAVGATLASPTIQMTSPTVSDFALARELVFAHSWNPIAYQILNPGIQLWFSQQRDAVIGYVKWNHVWVVAGAPVCSPTRIAGIIEEFESDAARERSGVCYFHVGPRFLGVVNNSPRHSSAAIGALPFWNPMRWDAVLRSSSSLRYQISRARNKGIVVTEMPAAIAATSQDLRDIRQQWLSRKHLPPLHFLIEPDIFGQLIDRRLFIASRNHKVIGYLLCTPMPNREGWLFEQWAHDARAPLGTSEALVHAAMSTFGRENFCHVTMGLVPLSKSVTPLGEPGPLWLRSLFRFMRLTANPLYNFKGLEHYKYKFRPHHSEAAYVVVNSGHFRPINVLAMAHAFAGSPMQLFAWQVLKKTFRRLMRHWGPEKIIHIQ
jgi:phosphatidylglycerol lysyltransferase